MAKIEILPIGPIRHPLIDMDFDLEPTLPPDSRGWLDRRTGLRFSLEREIKAVEYGGHVFGYWHFALSHPDLREPLIVAHFKSDVGGTPRTLTHRLSRSALFEWSNHHMKDARVAQIFADLGGREQVFDYCLKAIRACGCEPIGTVAVEGADRTKILRRFEEIDFLINE